ncbi:type 1 glutamine amidotransferase domain-containing protein [Sporomusa aerivorans]|uniref:type 1 glutamine amidotransferase domain-containing protein n=1 Tax=Sporomusa aerivorans TaxID=204936 RepID=UPI00352B8FE4
MTVQKQVLLVVTSFKRIDEEHSTGLWLEEFAVPYLALSAAGYGITVASPQGGMAPVDAESTKETMPVEWQATSGVLKNTRRLGDLDYQEYAAVILPGGHGPLFDLAKDKQMAQLLRLFARERKLIGAVCHGPAALVSATLADGRPLVAGRQVTAFSNEEEQMTHLSSVVPFLLESKLKELGARFVKKQPWMTHVVIDGNLVTGQNRQSSGQFSEVIVNMLAGQGG